MGYIYIFTNSEHPNMAKIGYADDWKKRLKAANEDPYNTAVIEAYALYEVEERLTDIRFHQIINALNPSLQYTRSNGSSTEYFNLDKDTVYKLFEGIAEISGTMDRLILISEGKEIRQGHKKNISDESNKPSDKSNKKRSSKQNLYDQSISSHKTKKEIIDYIQSHGHTLKGQTVTKAHPNAVSPYYWANPLITVLDDDWSLILDDDINHIYHVFEIPKGTIKDGEMATRNDVPKLDIRIKYDDDEYTDEASGIKFVDFKTCDIRYEEGDNIKTDTLPQAGSDGSNRSVFTDTKGTTTLPLSQISNDIKNCHIVSFEFDGKYYTTKYWKRALDVIMEYLYNKYPQQIENMAKYNYFLTDESEIPFLTKQKSLIDGENFPHNINGTNIWYKTNYSVATIVQTMKFLLKRFAEPIDNLVVTYEKK